jgi:5'-phosphate synthase pdxT subunit
MVVGVLALQGDFAEHEAALQRLGVATRQVRRRVDLDGLTGLVLPGGESGVMLRQMRGGGGTDELFAPLRDLCASGLPVFATCAGLILLAREVVDPSQQSFGILDVTVQRNGYGRQIASGTFALEGEGLGPDARGTFIRAPRVTRVGAGVEVLARRGGDPVLLRQGPILAACFHPELDEGHFATRWFVDSLAAASTTTTTTSATTS